MSPARSQSFLWCSRFCVAFVFHELKWCYLEHNSSHNDHNSSHNDHNWSQYNQIPIARVFCVLTGLFTLVVMQDDSREVILGNLQRRHASTDCSLFITVQMSWSQPSGSVSLISSKSPCISQRICRSEETTNICVSYPLCLQLTSNSCSPNWSSFYSLILLFISSLFHLDSRPSAG